MTMISLVSFHVSASSAINLKQGYLPVRKIIKKKIKYCNLNLEDEEFEDTKGDIMLCKLCI
jgi:hypothetical protein